MQLKSTNCTQHIRLVKGFYNADYETISRYLSSCWWQGIFRGCLTINEYWTTFHSLQSEIIETFIPVKVKRLLTLHNRYLPRPIGCMILLKRRAWKHWKAKPNAITKSAFNRASRRCYTAIKLHLVNKEIQLLSANSRQFFSHVSQRLHPQDNDIVLNNAKGPITDAPSLCETLCAEFKNFANTFVKEVPKPNNPVLNGSPNLTDINIDITTAREVLA